MLCENQTIRHQSFAVPLVLPNLHREYAGRLATSWPPLRDRDEEGEMAGDWIPAFADLPTKREVLAIASLTGRNRHEVVGRLIEFWIWAQEQSDGSVDAVVDVHVDALETALGPDPCFWLAVMRVGWLIDTPKGLIIPNAMGWLSRGAKARLKKTLRQNLWRQKQWSVDAPVDASVDGGVSSKTSTTEQNRTVHKEIPPIGPPLSGGTDTPTNSKAIVAKKRSPPRSYRVPPDWHPDDDDTARLVSLLALPPPMIPGEAAKFRDHEFRTSHSDWPATWRNWLREAARRHHASNGQSSSAAPRYRSTSEVNQQNIRNFLAEVKDRD